MPRRLVTADDGATFRIAEYDLAPLEPSHVRVRVRFAAPKHGTESHVLAGSAFQSKKWDAGLRMFLPRTEDDAPAPAPTERGIGNMVVGVVSEVGAGVTRYKVGDSVFGYGQVREVAQAPESDWYPLDKLSDADAVCVDPAHVAFVAVRDGDIRVGDHVAVFGLGAIGLLAVQVARAGGARRVYAVDPSPLRRAVAEKHGADAAFDPRQGDVALAIKRATDGHGVDVSIETSGSGKALHESIRCIRQCGTVVHVPWGPKDATDLRLDEEWHLNRPTLVGSQAVWQNADRSHPLWDKERAFLAAAELFHAGLLTGAPIVTPILDFADAPAALAGVFSRQDKAIKVGIRFPG